MTRRAYHHGDLKAALLERAERTLRERGVDALSLRELARESGVSPGAPSRHFRTKQVLLDALALEGYERLVEAIATAQGAAGPSFGERLEATARAYVGFCTDNAALVELMFSAKHSPEASPALADAAGRWAEQGLELVRAGQERGEVRADPLESVALTVFAPLQGYVGLATGGVALPAGHDRGLGDVIAAIIRACRPD
ncbi:TetR/AcrR family transcriptional regulator [Streptomyces sp. NPDC096057]|uniref:TetR/AcrR family transcriptional regulator n=1 Tax=Streptomyces sp. NPDC096057 TaxID=3155543 RepID=UPI003320AE93